MVSDVNAETINDVNSNIKDLEKEASELKEKQQSVDSDKKATEEKMDENLQEQNVIEKELDKINDELVQTVNSIHSKEAEIERTNDQIKELQDTIIALNEDIEHLKDRIQKRDILLKERLRSIQQNGGLIGYIEVLLESRNFGDFISRASVVNTIMDQDKTIMDEQAADKADLEMKMVEVENHKTEIEAEKKTLEEQNKELKSLQKSLNEQMAEKEKVSEQLKETFASLEDYKMDLQEEEQTLKDQEKVINDLKKKEQSKLNQLKEEQRRKEAEARRAAEQQKQQEQQMSEQGSPKPVISGNGTLSWPVPGYSLGSPYGYRSFNGGGFHYGIDIPAPTGTHTYAAASGIVTRSNYSSSYGHVIYVYHPDLDLTTVYAHLNQRLVSLGANVAKGQLIGHVGNTGHSFGAHLHFEVHQNVWRYHGGLNPMKYF